MARPAACTPLDGPFRFSPGSRKPVRRIRWAGWRWSSLRCPPGTCGRWSLRGISRHHSRFPADFRCLLLLSARRAFLRIISRYSAAFAGELCQGRLALRASCCYQVIWLSGSMMNWTDTGDVPAVSLSVTTTTNRPVVVGVPLITPPLMPSPGGRLLADQLYWPLPPEACRVRLKGNLTVGNWSPGFVSDNARNRQVDDSLIDALWVDGEVTVRVSPPFHGGDPEVTVSVTLTLPPAGIDAVDPAPDDQ